MRKPQSAARKRVFIEKMAASGDRVYAADKAGFPFPAQAAARLMADTSVAADIQKRVMRDLHEVILPLASAAHKRLLQDPNTPAGAVVAAVKLAYDHGLVTKGAGEKDLADMTADELRAASLAVRQQLAELDQQARTIDAEPVPIESPEASIFD